MKILPQRCRGAGEVNFITRRVIDCAIEIHRNLGPGLLESGNEVSLEKRLTQSGLLVQRQVVAPVHSKKPLTYLKLLRSEVGLLINFGSPTIKEGLHRIVNGFQETSSPPRLRASV